MKYMLQWRQRHLLCCMGIWWIWINVNMSSNIIMPLTCVWNLISIRKKCGWWATILRARRIKMSLRCLCADHSWHFMRRRLRRHRSWRRWIMAAGLKKHVHRMKCATAAIIIIMCYLLTEGVRLLALSIAVLTVRLMICISLCVNCLKRMGGMRAQAIRW